MSSLVVLTVILVQVLEALDLMTLDQRLEAPEDPGLMTLDQAPEAPEDRHRWICFMRVIRTWHPRELSSLVMDFLRQVVIHFS